MLSPAHVLGMESGYRVEPGFNAGLTSTVWCCSSSQCLGRIGKMVGGSRMPSSMWITPLEAGTSTLRTGMPSGPSRMRPWNTDQTPHAGSSPAGFRRPLLFCFYTVALLHTVGSMSTFLAQQGPHQVSCPPRYSEHTNRHEQGRWLLH